MPASPRTPASSSADRNASLPQLVWAQDCPPPVVVGVDFGGPRRVKDQRKKILAVEARRTGPGRYEVNRGGLNERLMDSPPGWGAGELAFELCGRKDPVLVAADFPFSIPRDLLEDAAFANTVGLTTPLKTWSDFRDFVASLVSIDADANLDALSGWRDADHRERRVTDLAARAHPPLQSRHQVMFNMTLVGAAFLQRLRSSGGFSISPFEAATSRCALEVYPGHALRSLGVKHYKREPATAIAAVRRFLERSGTTLDVDPDILGVCHSYSSSHPQLDHDAADALVACAIGIAAGIGAGKAIYSGSDRNWALEGVLWSLERHSGAIPPAPPHSGAPSQPPGGKSDRGASAITSSQPSQDGSPRSMSSAPTTKPGYVNRNGQVVIRKTDIRGTDHLQWVYVLLCRRCDTSYGANGSDIHARRCPSCQQGALGLAFK